MKSTVCFVFVLANIALSFQRPQYSEGLHLPSLKHRRHANPEQVTEPTEVMNIDPQVGVDNLPPRNPRASHIFHLKHNEAFRNGVIDKRSTINVRTPPTNTETIMSRKIPSFQEYLTEMGLKKVPEADDKIVQKNNKKSRDKPNDDDTPLTNEREENTKSKNKHDDNASKDKKDNDEEKEDDDNDNQSEDARKHSEGRISDNRKYNSKNSANESQNVNENLLTQYRALLDMIAAQNRFVVPPQLPSVHKHTTICHSLGRARRCSPVEHALNLNPQSNHLLNRVRYQSQLVKTITSGIFLKPPYL